MISPVFTRASSAGRLSASLPKTLVCALLAILVWACVPGSLRAAPEDQPPLKLQAFQGHSFDVGKEKAFNATFTVFQDLGCIVENADLKTGFITARTSAASAHGFSNVRFTAFVIETGKRQSRVRLTAIRVRQGLFGTSEFLEDNPTLYERFFARVIDSIATQQEIWGG